jgi:asparagine synthase (glutamine-hydrolysing)
MCGLVGFVDDRADGAADVERRVLAMARALAHRGPDDERLWREGPVALALRRLSILDLATGQQPMRGDRGAVIVHNGEIYNYLELRRDLEAAGERFRTESDTEVLLRLWERHGPACLDLLNGMFAFAIWDPRRRRLFLARDRLGEKPLFYFHSGRFLAFASEIKALLALERVRAGTGVDPRAVSDFLSYGYVLGPKTAFRGIERLPPAHYAVFDPETGSLRASDYWPIADRFRAPARPYDRSAREEFAALLGDAVRIRLRSDVPLGAFLSGGLDSSSIVVAMKRHAQGDVRAFCARFADSSYDETPYARTVADRAGVGLTEIAGDADRADHLGRLVWQTDEPFADTSILPTFRLCRAARQSVTVALSGDGGDELLAGYPTVLADRWYGLYRRLPLGVQRGAKRLADRLLRPSYRKVSLDYKVRQFLGAAGLSPERAHAWWRTVFGEDEKRELMSPALREACRSYDPFAAFAEHFARVAGASPLSRFLYVDIKTWLPDDILVKTDRMSMAHGLELRAPFLDHRLIELVAGFADEAKLAGARKKVILKDVMRPHLPATVIRRWKRGFSAPTDRLGALRPDPGSREWLNPEFRLRPRFEDVTYKSFALAVLNEWLAKMRKLEHTGHWAIEDACERA